jgi:putative transposase
LYDYFANHGELCKQLYNLTNFYYRQAFTGLKTHGPLQKLQFEAIQEIIETLEAMNENQQQAFEKKEKTRIVLKPIELQKTVKLTQFEEPSKTRAYLSYGFLDSFFKCKKQEHYRMLPTHTAQAIIQLVLQDWRSFYEAMKDYKKHPEKYKGRPKPPRYKGRMF